MSDIWEERKKALENEYFHKKEKALLEKMKEVKSGEMSERWRNHCPKCGSALEARTFRGVPLDQCLSCGGVWLGPNDLKILAEKDHRTWFEKWFRNEEPEGE